MNWTDIVLCRGEERNTYTVTVVDLKLVVRLILNRSARDRA
jgi:hypothetical protein